MQDILVPVSPGELLDKITILRIKSARMTDAAKLANVRHELAARADLAHFVPDGGKVVDEERALQSVNERLWEVEDRLRDLEAEQRFDADFIELARAVYVHNDERAAVKKRVNTRLGSTLVEEKSYRPYRPQAG
jgi:hypothetical protein